MPELAPVYAELRELMAPYAARLEVKHDDDTQLYVDTAHVQKNKKPLFFGAVQIKKAYVSYHLMALYYAPELLDGISPELRARMQGKSCFNFKTAQPELLAELAALTAASYDHFAAQGFVEPTG